MMLGLPKSTVFNKLIPKQKFYQNMDISPSLKKIFVEDVKSIYWRNKISSSTINVSSGESVTEIEVIEIIINCKNVNELLFRQIDKYIPYHILFLVKHKDKAQAWIGFKEKNERASTFKVNSYYHTEWMDLEDIKLTLKGLNIDQVYESFIRQIGGKRLRPNVGTESIMDTIARDAEKRILEDKISQLEGKIRREKQLNKQIEMRNELKIILNMKGEEYET